jgi:hypothetical protein
MLIAQVEDKANLIKQIEKQTVQPDVTFIYVDERPAQGLSMRRERIAQNHSVLLDAVERYQPDYIWQLEQDVDIEDTFLERMIELEKANDCVISGIQVGRHGLYCLGAWRNFKYEYNDIVKNKSDAIKRELVSFESIDYKLTGIQEVEAVGFYCLFAKTKNYVKEGVADYLDEYPYGPDVVYTRQFDKILCDMDLKVGHVTPRGIIRPEHISTCNVKFKKVNNRWEYKTL